MSQSKVTGEKVVSNLGWRFAERCGAEGVSLLVSIVLARLLAPEAYGIVALVTVVTGILQVFVDSGMASALIQKKDADELDFSTVFFFNIVFCMVLYIGLFFFSPLLAKWYKQPELTPVIRVLGLTVVISGVKNVQHAYVSRHLQFKRFFFATLTGTVIAAVVGIIMAYLGFGVWALVAQHLTNTLIDTVFLWFTTKWHPTRAFSFRRLKQLVSYGWKLLVAALLSTIFNDINQMVIGLKYSTADLSFYNKGKQFPSKVVSNLNTSIDSVLFPVMSSVQSDKERVKAMTRRAIKTSTFLTFPLMMGFAVTAQSFVKLLLTEKWLPCVPFLYIFCFTYACMPIHTANLNAMKAMGRSDIFLKLDIIKKIMSLGVLAATIPFGVLAIALGQVAISILSQIINAFPNRKLLNYSYMMQLKDIAPAFLLAAAMGGCIYPIRWIGLPDVATICLQVLIGIIIYLVGSAVFKVDSFHYLYSIVKPRLKKIRDRSAERKEAK